jgi:flagellin-like hook-associated protein FlgL
MAEMNKIYQDAGYKGVNLINGNDLTVTTNENSTTQVISSATLTVTGIGFTAATVSWTTAANIDTSITEAKAAQSVLRTTSSGFAADLGLLTTRESFTSELIETLEAGAGLLVNASLEEESANLLALQTRQSLGTSALTFANQVQQSVLQLFR